MTAEILDGKKTSQKLLEKLQQEVCTLAKKPVLAIMLVGENPASLIYVNAKLKKAESIGFKAILKQLTSNVTEKEIISL